jgi:cellobiose epimerase
MVCCKKFLLCASVLFAYTFSDGQKMESERINRLKSIQARVNDLGNQIFSFWNKYGTDTVYGGFFGTLDEKGFSKKPYDKGVIAQSRHLWAFSTWYEMKEQSKEVKAVCHNLYKFIIAGFYDRTSREFCWMTNREGEVNDPMKRLYSNSFAILGLSAYARVFKDPVAAEYAMQCFRAIDKRAHDSLNGGYFQTDEHEWVTAKGAVKETNTHIHLLESFTALYEVTRDKLVKERLEEMLRIVAFKLPQPKGYVHLQFMADWTPVDKPVVSYGHDLETAWLIYDAARVLGKCSDRDIMNQVIKMGTLSGNEGLDTVYGGYYSSGIPNYKVTDFSKVWWVQAEALNGLFRLYSLTGETQWLEKLDKTLSWIERCQVNKSTGEWYYSADEHGNPTSTTDMGNFWKASYHDLRAMMFLNLWINEYLHSK